MKVKVNGIEMNVMGDTIAKLLKELNINENRVVVEVNLEIVKRDYFDRYKIKEGDSIEIVNFVGGG